MAYAFLNSKEYSKKAKNRLGKKNCRSTITSFMFTIYKTVESKINNLQIQLKNSSIKPSFSYSAYPKVTYKVPFLSYFFSLTLFQLAFVITTPSNAFPCWYYSSRYILDMSQHATDTRLGQIDDHPLISSPNNWSKIARPTLVYS